MKISNNNSERLPGDGVEYHELEQPETYDVIPDNNVYSGMSACVSLNYICLCVYLSAITHMFLYFLDILLIPNSQYLK